MNPLRNLFRRFFSSKPAAARRPQSVRLGVEVLENRLVPSASSLGVHAIQDATGHSAAFFLNPANHAFYEKTPAGTVVKLSDANTVTGFSAGLDGAGNADVFAIRNGALAEFDSTGWHSLNQPEAMLSFAAVKGDRLYAVGADNWVWEYSGGGQLGVTAPEQRVTGTTATWTKLLDLKSTTVDAVTDIAGRDVVFTKGIDGSLNVLIGSSIGKAANAGTYYNFSAGLDVNGYATVDIVMKAGAGAEMYAYRWTGSGANVYSSLAGFQDMGPTRPDAAISATTNGQLFGSYFSTLFQATGTSLIGFGNNNISTISSLSAASPTDVFVMDAQGQLKEFNPITNAVITYGYPRTAINYGNLVQLNVGLAYAAY